MAKYTMELRRVISLFNRSVVESWFTDYELNDYLTQEEINVINNTGLFSKERIARDIVDNYYMREIGFETPMLFKHYAKIKMRKIMEEKLPLIYSASIKYDPLINVDYTETFTRNIDNKQESKSSDISKNKSSASGLTVNSDTPQGQINKQKILDGSYASSTSAGESSTDSESSGNSNSNGTSNTEESYSKNVKGNSGVSATAQAMIKQYRENILTITKDIIEECNDLFMGLW